MDEESGRSTHKVGLQIIVLVVDTIIDHGNNNSSTSDRLFPYWGHIHHMLRELLIDEMPLVREDWINDAKS